MGCDGCSGCGNKKDCAPKISNYLGPIKEDAYDMLHKKNITICPNSESLDGLCDHWPESQNVKRGQCEKCIRTWVWAMGRDAVEAKIKEEREAKVVSVLADRLEEALRDYLKTLPIEK